MDSAPQHCSTGRQQHVPPHRRYGRLRSSWARWATRQVKAAQLVGDHQSAALFLSLAQGLSDAQIADVRLDRA